jgi:hypothetical protein
MKLLSISDIIKGVGNIADDLHTSEEERLKISLEEKKLGATLIQGQLAINEKEASHASVFVAGWRPFIGWIGGFALAYQFVLYPLLIWVWALGQAQGWIPCHITEGVSSQVCTFSTPPVLDSGALFAMLTGLLGIGGMRSFDKLKKTDTKRIDFMGD